MHECARGDFVTLARDAPSPFVPLVPALVSLLVSCAAPAVNRTPPALPVPLAPAVTSAATAPPPRDDGRLPATARPLAYTLSLAVDPSHERFGGSVEIAIDVAESTRFIVLHSRRLDVRSAALVPAAGGAAAIATVTARRAAGSRNDPEELVLAFPNAIAPGRATLTLTFDAPFDPALRGLYRVQTEGRWYAFTQFEANDARRAFPCFDEPSAKVPWTVSLTVPRDAVAVSNMPEASRTTVDPEHVAVHFAPTPPVPSYLVAFAVGPFDVVEGARSPVPVRAITVHGRGNLTRDILAAAPAHVQILADYFDLPFPYPKLDLVAVPDFGAGAMENPGLITFREDLMLLDPEHAPTIQRRSMASVLAHELAHHWFGDLVTMAWWDDLWLNEGFATWMQSRVVDTWRPETHAALDAVRDRAGAMGLDALPSSRAVRQPVRSTSDAEEAFDGITYTKGGAILAMLETWLGPEVFRTGVRRYVHDHAFGNATAHDLLAALSVASGRTDVEAVATSFLDQAGLPIVDEEIVCAAGEAPVVRLRQSPYSVLGAALEGGRATARWHLPVVIGTPGPHVPSAMHTDGIVLDGDEGALTLRGACPSWIVPNANGAGYFHTIVRDHVPPASALPTLDRLVAIRDAWAATRAGRLPLAALRAELVRLRDAQNRTVLGATLDVYGTLVATLTQDRREPVRAELAAWLRPVAHSLGWEGRAGEDDEQRLRRRDVLQALGQVALDTATLHEADALATRYWSGTLTNPELTAVAVPIAGRLADAARIDAVIARLHPATLPLERQTLLGFLSNVTGDALVTRALDASLTDALRVQDIARLVYGLARDPDRRAVVRAWVGTHLGALQQRLPGDTVGGLAGLLGGTCAPGETAAYASVWEPHASDIEGVTRSLAQGGDFARQCTALRAYLSAP